MLSNSVVSKKTALIRKKLNKKTADKRTHFHIGSSVPVHRMSITAIISIEFILKGLIGDHWTFIGSYHLIEQARGVCGVMQEKGGAQLKALECKIHSRTLVRHSKSALRSVLTLSSQREIQKMLGKGKSSEMASNQKVVDFLQTEKRSFR